MSSSADPSPARTTGPAPAATDEVWAALEKASFAVVAHVTPRGEPRSSGVLLGVARRHLFVVTDAGSWKARHIHDGDVVAVTVPIRRGGLLSLVAPIPPATVSCHARATVHPPGSLDPASVSQRLASLLPEHRRDGSVVLELVPEGEFVTYGLGVPLRRMADPAAAAGRVPVG